METIIDYKVLMVWTSVDVQDIDKILKRLEEKVKKYIYEGYQPFGGIAITTKAYNSVLYLSQAVVKYE